MKPPAEPSLGTERAVMAEPLVSIGMPVYNGAATLREAMDSLRTQTHASLELIVSDNASTDDSLAIAEEAARRDPRIRVHRNPVNRGAAWNFRHVLELARGDYFLWASHDDRWLPRFVEANLDALRSDDHRVASVSKVRALATPPYITSDTFPLFGEPGDNVLAYLRHPGTNSRMYGVFRREVLLRSVGDEVLWAFDWLWVVRTLRYGHYHEVPEVLLERRPGGESFDKASAVRRYNTTRIGRMLPKWPLTRYLWAEPHVPKNAALVAWILRANLQDAAVAFYDWLCGAAPLLRPIMVPVRRALRRRG